MKETRVNFSTEWARTPAAAVVRETVISHILGPAIDVYTHPRVSIDPGFGVLEPPVIFASNHSSHLDTPIILKSVPRRWRRKTAVVAAADYFYQNRAIASLVSLVFGTIPIERARLSRDSMLLINGLIQKDWSLLFYPEGTRSRDGSMGRMRSGTGFLAVEYGLPVVPISLKGTYQAMPPGRFWPVHHPVTVRIAAPVTPMVGEEHRAFTARLQGALDELAREPHPP